MLDRPYKEKSRNNCSHETKCLEKELEQVMNVIRLLEESIIKNGICNSNNQIYLNQIHQYVKFITNLEICGEKEDRHIYWELKNLKETIDSKEKTDHRIKGYIPGLAEIASLKKTIFELTSSFMTAYDIKYIEAIKSAEIKSNQPVQAKETKQASITMF